MTSHKAVAAAEAILPGQVAPEGQPDPRWQAIIGVGTFVEAEPEVVWPFALKWGSHSDADLRSAVATCLLEHLLEHHFSLIFPLALDAAKASPTFAETLRSCWEFGEAADPANRAALRSALADLETPKTRQDRS